MKHLFFLPTDWNKHNINSFFYGYINKQGRYCPLKRFTVDKLGKRIFESDNTHKGCQFLEGEIVPLIN